MNGWKVHRGSAVSLPVDNIDTDQLIPARFMSRPRADGYADLLLYDFRRNASGEEDASFLLNRYPTASVLIAGRNFGSGSSREAAVYALVDAGIRVVMATSFGDIFTANAVNNGLLPACINDADYRLLTSRIEQSETMVCVNLATNCIIIDNQEVPFYLADALRIKLMNGWDDIDLTMNYAEEIAAFRNARQHDQPWSTPAQSEQNNDV